MLQLAPSDLQMPQGARASHDRRTFSERRDLTTLVPGLHGRDANQAKGMANSEDRILIINAALNGSEGNTAVLLQRAKEHLTPDVNVSQITLAGGLSYGDVRSELQRATGFLFGTGTHWDSWSHLLQRFLEDATDDEGCDVWLGKPAAVIVTMHSVGGKAVLSRLQGVLNTFGCLIPPMSGMVYSRVSQAMLQSEDPAVADVWSPDDVTIICHNLRVALSSNRSFQAWPSDHVAYTKRWIR